MSRPEGITNSARFFLLALVFAGIGLYLILVLAPELTERWRWLSMTYERETPEYWAAMVIGGMCLLTSGSMLIRAISGDKD
jgi:hypothetical protein